jgi:UDP-N-acetylglucosamine pyrophosphorylase
MFELNRMQTNRYISHCKTSRSFAVWEVRRDEEFSPLKNGSGSKDTAVTCRHDLMAQHILWLQRAGAQLPADIQKQT